MSAVCHRPISAARLSDGTLRFIAILATLLNPNPPPLICIEEPELGVHPDALAIIADLLIEASNRMQIMVTTHSDALVSALTNHPDAIVACEKPQHRTTLRRLTDPQRLHELAPGISARRSLAHGRDRQRQPVSSIGIYMEGGGPTKSSGRAALRQGMERFLAALKQRAREASWHWKPCRRDELSSGDAREQPTCSESPPALSYAKPRQPRSHRLIRCRIQQRSVTTHGSPPSLTATSLLWTVPPGQLLLRPPQRAARRPEDTSCFLSRPSLNSCSPDCLLADAGRSPGAAPRIFQPRSARSVDTPSGTAPGQVLPASGRALVISAPSPERGHRSAAAVSTHADQARRRQVPVAESRCRRRHPSALDDRHFGSTRSIEPASPACSAGSHDLCV